MTRYTEFRFYSVELDAPAVRVSVPDERGAEYYAIVEAGGKGYRDRRELALEELERAIEKGWPAGCIAIIPAR